jgi:hypothetical protein
LLPDLELDAFLGLDLLDLPGLPLTLPAVGDMLAPLKPAAETLRTTVSQAGALLNPLQELLG